MSSVTGGERVNPYKRGLLEAFEGSTPYARLQTLGDMGALAVRSVKLAVRPPFPWWRDMIQQVSLGIRRSIIPMVFAHGAYIVGFGIIMFAGILANLGIGDRVGGVMLIIWDREIATWITGMIFAGIVGAAVTADLGARKIREELDALAVLGVEQTRTLIVPRVVACTLGMPVLVIISLLITQLFVVTITPTLYGYDTHIYVSALKSLIVPSDLYFTTLLKNIILGFFVGVVACYKGVSSKSGAEGVGRAVNQTVVITFFGIWLFNSLFNFAYFTLFSDATALRG
ncbi:MAG: phospholipid/cholesterol/gamma-HCH transport system permease protein [Solirubrobacteraceae bacterium]|jgi:phospholipid/cholesterol/gamma-HCH transport system permease protein|nr:phospholipid/cholesterol/gamma-HCH transport system permease protein [Solirubrobacteraceae bacterium]